MVHGPKTTGVDGIITKTVDEINIYWKDEGMPSLPVFSPPAELKKKPYPLRTDGYEMEKQIPGFCFPSCGMRMEPVGRHWSSSLGFVIVLNLTHLSSALIPSPQVSWLALIITRCSLESLEKSQLRNYLDGVGLWACLWGIILIINWFNWCQRS